MKVKGWTQEGIGWYSDESEGVPVYRQYNPYATTGTHNYTTDEEENNKLIGLGWNGEKIGWYGVDTLKTFAVYSNDDKSLNFYRRDAVPTVGSKFNNKTVTALYQDLSSDRDTSITDQDIEKVDFVDKISPTSTKYWFYRKTNLKTINNIKNLDTRRVTNMSTMFAYCRALTSLDVSKFDTSKVTNMNNMFNHCEALKTLDLSSFNASSVTDMTGMFIWCSGLTTLNVSKFDTGKVTLMSDMFARCSSLTTLDLSNFSTSKVTDMQEMFAFCGSLTSLNVSKFDTSQVTNMRWMFYTCSALPSLDLSSFNTAKVTNTGYMFCDCSALTSVTLSSKFSTAATTDVQAMFRNCSKLSLDCSSWNVSNVTNCDNFNSNATGVIAPTWPA